MTGRIVVELRTMIQEAAVGAPTPHTVVLIVREPDGNFGTWQFTCTGNEDVFGALTSENPETDVVTAAGRLLFDAVTGPQPVRDLMTTALAVQSPDRRPIYLDLSDAKDSQLLPWEALCTSGGRFLALDPCWPVGRIVGGAPGAEARGTLEPPLRLAAVLSCLGVEARQEWDALRAAVESSGAPVTMLLLVSETALHDELVKLGLPWVRVCPVPIEFPELRRLLSTFEPHLLHFFCHGMADGGPHLEVATARDWLSGEGTSEHRLEAKSIRDLIAAPAAAPWAIVLNACSSAADQTDADAHEAVDTHSLAATLVADRGIPAVIGMREPVDVGDAARFTAAFYGALLVDLKSWVDARASGVTIDWASYTVQARSDLCRGRDLLFDAAAARYKQWTLPAVIVRPTPFTIDVAARPGDPQDRERAVRLAAAAAAILAELPPDAPPETLAAFRQLLEEQLLHAGGRT